MISSGRRSAAQRDAVRPHLEPGRWAESLRPLPDLGGFLYVRERRVYLFNALREAGSVMQEKQEVNLEDAAR